MKQMMELVQEECLLPVHLGVVLLHIAAGVELLLVQRPVGDVLHLSLY